MAITGYLDALTDFRRARRRATMETLLARLHNHPSVLLSYEEVRRITGAQRERRRGLQEIPFDNIVGSVDRYADFTRSFLPRNDNMEERWARVMALANSREGWPPIEVYQIGDAYFVIDGHHRVSAARAMGVDTFPAYVIEVDARVPVKPHDNVEELVLRKEQYAFLRRTQLPETESLRVTEPDGYRTLVEHIDVHRYYMGLEQQREIPYEEAAARWHDGVFEPVAAIIRQMDLLEDFPDRTEADLYLWLVDHRAQLEETLDEDVRPEQAAEALKQQKDRGWERKVVQLTNTLLQSVATRLSPAA